MCFCRSKVDDNVVHWQQWQGMMTTVAGNDGKAHVDCDRMLTQRLELKSTIALFILQCYYYHKLLL